MAKFRNTFATAADGAPAPAAEESLHDRSLGDLLVGANHLTSEQVAQVLDYQQKHDVRFGEAAIALGMVSGEDVLRALGQQFHYPYAVDGEARASPEIVVANEPFGIQAEAFRALRSQVLMRLFSNPEEPRRALAVMSPDSGDGRTFFAANLAVALSQIGGRTLLLDADMRSSRQHEVFRIENATGLSTILSGRNASNVIQPVRGLPSLFVLPCGATPPNPLELVERPAFGLLVKELLNKFDHVVVDTPAACYGTDFAVIAAKCGAGLLVSRRNQNRLEGVENCLAIAGQGGVKMAGIVVNDH
jgi:chain length determinant protein tyrosine kinase EpsG